MSVKLTNSEYKKGIIKRTVYGLFMGFSDSVPGYSGGTTLNLLNFYDELINRLKLVFKKNSFKNWFNNILWLVPFLLMWLISIFLFSFIGKLISKNNFDLSLIFLFMSFSIFCIPLFLKEQNQNFGIYKWKNNPKKTIKSITMIIFGFLVFIGISLGVYFNGGINLKHESLSQTRVDKSKWILLIIVSFVAGFVMLIPGISGQLIFYLANLYKDFSWVILQNPFSNFDILSLIAISGCLGSVLSVFVINFMIRKFNLFFVSFSTGLVLASPLAILLGMLGNNLYLNELSNLSSNVNLLVAIIFCILLGLIVNFVLYVWFRVNNIEIDSKYKKSNFVYISGTESKIKFKLLKWIVRNNNLNVNIFYDTNELIASNIKDIVFINFYKLNNEDLVAINYSYIKKYDIFKNKIFVIDKK